MFACAIICATAFYDPGIAIKSGFPPAAEAVSAPTAWQHGSAVEEKELQRSGTDIGPRNIKKLGYVHLVKPIEQGP